ncbi:hypothetical protein ACIRQY_35435, partial [Streptomyces sp. NPDC101490]
RLIMCSDQALRRRRSAGSGLADGGQETASEAADRVGGTVADLIRQLSDRLPEYLGLLHAAQQPAGRATADTGDGGTAAMLTDVGAAWEGAPRLLADRLTDRLAETGGEAMVTGPYGWLIRRGLPQRQACSHRECDDGVCLDTGEDCENCGNVVHLRCARRARIGADIDRELPGLADGELRRVLEERLREHTALEAEDLAWRREQAGKQQAARMRPVRKRRSRRSASARPRQTRSGWRWPARTAAGSGRPGCARRATTSGRPRP